MVKGTVDTRIRAVLLYIEDVKEAGEVCTALGISRRTLTRWVKAYKDDGVRGLEAKKPGPRHTKNSIPKKLEERILKLKQKHPSWGARRLMHQYDLPCHWRTVPVPAN